MSGLGFARFVSLAGSRGWPEVFIAGMDFGCEALRGGDLSEERRKLFCFGGLEAGAHEVVVGACEVADLGEGFCAARGEVQRVEAAVLGVGRAGDEFAGFEGVEDGDEAAGVHAEGFGELLLAGVSVPVLFYRLVPKWIAILGLVLAGSGVLSWLSIVFPLAMFLIPLTRFPGFVWMIAVGFALPNAARRVEARG